MPPSNTTWCCTLRSTYAKRSPCCIGPRRNRSLGRSHGVPPPPATSSSFAAVSPAQKSTTPTLAQERAQIVKRIADIQAQMSPWAGTALGYRSRTGTAGLSTLSEINGTLAASTTLGDAGRLTASVSAVHLYSGGQPAPADAQLVGTAPLYKGSVPVVTDSATGSAIELAFTRPNWQVNFGTTPLGFLVHGITGGVSWRPAGSPFDLQVKRSPVLDSMLSYAGLYDPYTGSNWGGVFANTLQISAGNGHDPVRYGSVSYSLIQGTHVAENQSWSVDAGLRWPIATDDPDQKLQVGGNLLVMGYQRNLSFFTYGQGGYFSPSVFYRPSLTVDWDGRIGDRTAWHLGGRLGYQSFRQESSPYFPNDPLFEAESGQQYYPAQNVSGIAYAMDGDISYLLTKRWLGGGWFGVDNSHNYQNMVVGLYLQYFFNPQIATHASGRIRQSLWVPQD